LLFSWRRDFREGRLGGADFPDLVPAVVFPDPELPSLPVVGKSVADGRVEIVIGADRRVIVGADVDATALALVLEDLRRR
jgi:transposase